MIESFDGRGEPLRVDEVHTALAKVAEVLGTTQGMDQIDALAGIVGDTPSYNALIQGSEAFLQTNPGALRHGMAAPEVTSLWIGLVVGAGLRK